MKALTPAKLALRVVQQRLGRNRPLVATLLVTARCNVRCDGCVYYDNLDDRGRGVEESTERALLILDKLGEARLLSVSFAGGEPFLRPDLPVVAATGTPPRPSGARSATPSACRATSTPPSASAAS